MSIKSCPICGTIQDGANGEIHRLRARVAVLEAALREALPIVKACRASVATKGEAYEDKESRAHYCEIHIETALKGAQT